MTVQSGPAHADRIAKVDAIAVRVPFRKEFRLGSGTVSGADLTGPVLFVRIETASGLVGWGEQRAVPTWSYETIETMTAVVRYHLAALAIGLSPFDVATFHDRADAALSPSVSNGMPFARAAMDVAFHDLAGKLAGVPVHALLGGAVRDRIPLCSALSAAAPDEMAAAARESAAYAAYKLKITGDVALDAARIRAVAAVAGDKPLWLDANQAYVPSRFLRLLDDVRDVSTLYCAEQPTKSPDWAGLAAIRGRSHLPVAIDEGCFTATDLAKVVRHEAADMVVLKVCKAGGLRRVLHSAAVAQANGIELLGSGLTDCGVAFAAALHVFAALPLSLPAELNGPELLTDMLVSGLDITDAVAAVPTAPGLGVTPDLDRLRDLAIPDLSPPAGTW